MSHPPYGADQGDPTTPGGTPGPAPDQAHSPGHGTPPWGPQPGGPYPQQPPGPPYGNQPYQPYPPAYGPRTNTMAILALVAALVFAPAGLILGILALREINRTGEEGRGLAIAGAVIGGTITGFVLLWILIAFGAFVSIFSFASSAVGTF